MGLVVWLKLNKEKIMYNPYSNYIGSTYIVKLNNDAMWIDYKELLEDSLLQECNQRYRKNAIREHMLYDVMEFRSVAEKYCKELKEEAKKLKFKLDKNGNFKHNNFYMKNLATIKNIELRNYCYCVLFYNTISWSKEYYSTKGHPYNVDDIFNEYI